MPKAVEIKSTEDLVGRKLKKGTKVAFTFYKDGQIHTGTVTRITAGIINPQVYVEYVRSWTDWKGKLHSVVRTVRRPAKSVARIN